MKVYAARTRNKLVDSKYVQPVSPDHFGDVTWNLTVGVVLAEIATWDLPNTKQVCCVLDRDFLCVGANTGAVLQCVTEV
jgi:hypothetical protein